MLITNLTVLGEKYLHSKCNSVSLQFLKFDYCQFPSFSIPFPFCPTFKQAERVCMLSHLTLVQDSNPAKSCLQLETHPFPLPHHNKNTNPVSFLCSFKTISEPVGRPTLLSPETLILWVITFFYSFLVCTWHYYFRYTNQILNGFQPAFAEREKEEGSAGTRRLLL